ncbi:ATP-NAD kinase-like domain-containing protein [Syncephalis fuscata]|nr:ATP-NAD kinase-like domain-containing protein [Syncephalis fuscata]
MPSQRKVAFIVNGVAGGGKGYAVWNEVKPLVEADYPLGYTMASTERSGHAIELAQSFVTDGYELIVAIGGDGTINQVINGYLLAGGKERGTVIGVMSGTGGDFIRSLNMNKLTSKMAWAGLATYRPVPEPVSTASHEEQRYFINICSLGMTAEVVKSVENRSLLKKWSRSFAYWVQGVLTHLPYYPLHPVTLSWSSPSMSSADVASDSAHSPTATIIKEKVKLYFAAICNGQYFGGGMRVAPDAQLSSGRLELVRVRDINLYRALAHIIPGLKEGQVLTKAGPAHAVSASCTTFKAEPDPLDESFTSTFIELDGEFVGSFTSYA